MIVFNGRYRPPRRESRTLKDAVSRGECEHVYHRPPHALCNAAAGGCPRAGRLGQGRRIDRLSRRPSR